MSTREATRVLLFEVQIGTNQNRPLARAVPRSTAWRRLLNRTVVGCTRATRRSPGATLALTYNATSVWRATLLSITENTEIKQPRATEKYKKNSKAFFSV